MTVSVTIDVEDFYDPQALGVFGQSAVRPTDARSGLEHLSEIAADCRADDGRHDLTLFVVGAFLPTVKDELAALIEDGHELASHGPDHGPLPVTPNAVLEWLRKGKRMLEDTFQAEVSGFRSPRFDVPEGMPLAGFRDLIAEAGYSYVSDIHVLGAGTPVAEIPVFQMGRFKIGGGSYQRLLPSATVLRLIEANTTEHPLVLYYHSYDFRATLPSPWKSLFFASEVLGRGRIPPMVRKIIGRFGSCTCASLVRAQRED